MNVYGGLIVLLIYGLVYALLALVVIAGKLVEISHDLKLWIRGEYVKKDEEIMSIGKELLLYWLLGMVFAPLICIVVHFAGLL